MRGFLYNSVFILLVITVPIGAAVGLVSITGTYKCNSYSEATGREVKFVYPRCYVKQDDVWYTRDEYKYINIQGGVL